MDVLEKKVELQKLPLSRAVFLKGFKRAQYQCIIWKSILTNQCLTNIARSGTDKYIHVMTTLPPAPETPLQLIKCGCNMSVCEPSRCKCKANHLCCTGL